MTGQEQGYHSFPVVFRLRAMGEDRDDFAGLVLALVQKHIPEVSESSISSRPSRAGKYVSVTIQFTAESKAQLNAVYLELNQNERVLMVL